MELCPPQKTYPALLGLPDKVQVRILELLLGDAWMKVDINKKYKVAVEEYSDNLQGIFGVCKGLRSLASEILSNRFHLIVETPTIFFSITNLLPPFYLDRVRSLYVAEGHQGRYARRKFSAKALLDLLPNLKIINIDDTELIHDPLGGHIENAERIDQVTKNTYTLKTIARKSVERKHDAMLEYFDKTEEQRHLQLEELAGSKREIKVCTHARICITDHENEDGCLAIDQVSFLAKRQFPEGGYKELEPTGAKGAWLSLGGWSFTHIEIHQEIVMRGAEFVVQDLPVKPKMSEVEMLRAQERLNDEDFLTSIGVTSKAERVKELAKMPTMIKDLN